MKATGTMPEQAQDHVSVSVIIPTRNRRVLLREVIESLWSQTLDSTRFEIIVVDNCSTDGTGEMIEAMQATSPCALRYHRMPMNRGPVRSRNTAVWLARAPILAFTDSDCRVTPHWLARGLEPFADEDVAFVSGPVLDKPGQPVTFFSVGNALRGENPTYPTANVFYRKKTLWELGGFDESVWVRDAGGTPLECADADLAWRTKEHGHRSVFLDDLIVYHEIERATPWHWLAVQTRVMLVPEMVRRHAGFRSRMLWWGPFCLADNLLFYLAVLGTLLALAGSRWGLALTLPYLYRATFVPGRRFSLTRLPVIITAVFFFSLRQAVICGSLLYGSLRARTLVL
jgi:glycosyltransferase involved in cell wall biosynthesis